MQDFGQGMEPLFAALLLLFAVVVAAVGVTPLVLVDTVLLLFVAAVVELLNIA